MITETIYIIEYKHKTEIVTREYWERELQACYKLGLNYVVRNHGVSKELVVCN